MHFSALRRLGPAVLALLLAFGTAVPSHAQRSGTVDLEIEPVAYLLGGGGLHVGYQADAWNYAIEGFRVEVPDALHGNDGFEAAPVGLELHAERIFGEGEGGLYVGPEVGVTRLEVTHEGSGQVVHRWRYAVGVRGGYRWYPGLGNLYLSPVAGISYTLNSAAVVIEGETFDNGPITPFATVGLGWTF